MKRILLSLALFFLAFGAAYLACCYLVPGWRIKLAADAWTYFQASLRQMVPLKSGIALAAGLLAAALPWLPPRRS